MSDLRIIYRLSDAGEKKLNLPEISNAYCLNNFLSHFPASIDYRIINTFRCYPGLANYVAARENYPLASS